MNKNQVLRHLDTSIAKGVADLLSATTPKKWNQDLLTDI